MIMHENVFFHHIPAIFFFFCSPFIEMGSAVDMANDCVHVCVCVREREREREYVCVCVFGVLVGNV